MGVRAVARWWEAPLQQTQGMRPAPAAAALLLLLPLLQAALPLQWAGQTLPQSH